MLPGERQWVAAVGTSCEPNLAKPNLNPCLHSEMCELHIKICIFKLDCQISEDFSRTTAHRKYITWWINGRLAKVPFAGRDYRHQSALVGTIEIESGLEIEG